MRVEVECPHCFKIYKTERELKSHIVIHNDHRYFQCPLEGCTRTQKHYTNIGAHLMLHHYGLDLKFLTKATGMPVKNLDCLVNGNFKLSFDWVMEYKDRDPLEVKAAYDEILKEAHKKGKVKKLMRDENYDPTTVGRILKAELDTNKHLEFDLSDDPMQFLI